MRKCSILLLDRNYLPKTIVSWKRAVDLVISRCKAEIVEGEATVENFNPSVIRLLVWSPNPFEGFKKQGFSKTNVFRRDRWKCQYCGIKCTKDKATVDHIIPKSRGGVTSYLNCTTCCISCNKYKGSLTLQEAGMRLLSEPRMIEYRDRLPVESIKEEWTKWLPF